MFSIIKPRSFHNVLKSNTFANNKRFFTIPTTTTTFKPENYTLKLLFNRCSQVEVDKLKGEGFMIDGQEIRKNASRILINTNFFRTTAISCVLVGAKIAIGFHVPFVTVLAKAMLCFSIPHIAITLLFGNGAAIKLFEPDNSFLANYKYYRASCKLLDIKNDEFKKSITNITPEILLNLTHSYLFASNVFLRDIEEQFTSLIRNNKKFFDYYFETYAKYICFCADKCRKIENIILGFDYYKSNENILRIILEILQKECGKKINPKMKIKENLIFEDYNRTYFNIDEPSVNITNLSTS